MTSYIEVGALVLLFSTVAFSIFALKNAHKNVQTAEKKTYLVKISYPTEGYSSPNSDDAEVDVLSPGYYNLEEIIDNGETWYRVGFPRAKVLWIYKSVVAEELEASS